MPSFVSVFMGLSLEPYRNSFTSRCRRAFKCISGVTLTVLLSNEHFRLATMQISVTGWQPWPWRTTEVSRYRQSEKTHIPQMWAICRCLSLCVRSEYMVCKTIIFFLHPTRVSPIFFCIISYPTFPSAPTAFLKRLSYCLVYTRLCIPGRYVTSKIGLLCSMLHCSRR